MENNKVINIIKDSVEKSNCKKINEVIINNEELKIIIDLLGLESSKIVYTNVPISSIISLERNDYFSRLEGVIPEEHSWRDVFNILRGDDWDEVSAAIFSYFESDIRAQIFPPKSSQGILKLASYQGITQSSWGNHRLVAAICWLASNYGEDHELKKVYTSLYKFKKERVKALKKLTEKYGTDIEIYIGYANDGFENYGRITEKIIKVENRYFTFGLKGEMTLLFEPQGFTFSLSEKKRRKEKKKYLDDKIFKPISHILLDRLFSNNDWFDTAYEDAELVKINEEEYQGLSSR